MSTLKYVGRNPDSDGIIVPKTYADTQFSATALTSAAVNAQVSSTAALLTNQSYVDIQDSTLAKKTAVTAADTAYVSNTLLNAASGVAGLDSSGNLLSAQLPTGIPTDRVLASYHATALPQVAFEALGTTGALYNVTSTNTKTYSGSHTSAGGTYTVVLAYVDSIPNGSAVGVPGASVTYGGQAMTLWGTPLTAQNPGTASAFGGVFYLFNPPTGAQTVTTTVTGSGSITWFASTTTISYTNVGSLGTPVTNANFTGGVTTANLNNVPNTVPGGLVSAMFGQSSDSGSSVWNSCNQLIRYNNTTGTTTGMYVLIAEAGATGASSYSFTATMASSGGFGAIGVPLNPGGPPSAGTITLSGSYTATTGSSPQQLGFITVPDPGYPWRPVPMAWVQGDSSGATQPANRSTGTGNYGLLTVKAPSASQVYGAGICTGSFYPDYYPVLPYAANGQTPTSVPPINGGLELDLMAQLWSGTTYTFYAVGLTYFVLVVPAL